MFGTLQSLHVMQESPSKQNNTSAMKNGPWISADVQACIEPPTIPLIKKEWEELHATDIIKVKIRRNPSQAKSETYNMNTYTFDNVQPEELLTLLRNFKIAIGGTDTTAPTGWINYLHTMICGKSLRKFDELSLKGNNTNNHLNLILSCSIDRKS